MRGESNESKNANKISTCNEHRLIITNYTSNEASKKDITNSKKSIKDKEQK